MSTNFSQENFPRALTSEFENSFEAKRSSDLKQDKRELSQIDKKRLTLDGDAGTISLIEGELKLVGETANATNYTKQQS